MLLCSLLCTCVLDQSSCCTNSYFSVVFLCTNCCSKNVANVVFFFTLFFLCFQPKLMVTASFGIEPGRRVEYIPLVEKALELSSYKPSKVLIFNRPNMVSTKKKTLQLTTVATTALCTFISVLINKKKNM